MFIFVCEADLEILMLFVCPSVRDNVENEWPEWHKWPDDRKLRRQFTVWYIFILPSLLQGCHEYSNYSNYSNNELRIDPFVLSVCPEIWLRIPSLSICFLRICMINLAMCMLQLRWCSGISTDTIYYSISRWQRTTEFFFSTHKPQNLLIHTYRTKSSTTTTWQDLRSPNLHPTNPT